MEELTLRAEHLATAINCLLPACQGNVRTDSAPQPEYRIVVGVNRYSPKLGRW